jgi:transcription-repair coupling factor (superfamily II helicase)
MSELHEILRSLAGREPVRMLAISLAAQLGARIQAAPAPAAARVPLVAALALGGGAPILYVVNTTDAALRARDDLCQWLGSERVLLFPAIDALPYEHMSPGPDVLAARLRALRALSVERWVSTPAIDAPTMSAFAVPAEIDSALNPQRPALIIVAPVKALTQPTLTPAELADATTPLQRGQEISLDDLMGRLITLGYRVAPTVEEPGEINRRGGIIDIFPPGDELPLRVEFFGDEIDSLRRFDPVTQRSEAQVREVVVGPPHEFPLWRRDEAVARIQAVDVSHLRREALDEWRVALDRLEHGERFEGRALFAPFFRAEPSSAGHSTENLPSLLLHMPPGATLALNDQALLAQHVADMDQQAETRRSAQIEAGELPRSFPRPYLHWNEILTQGSALAQLSLTNNERAPAGWDLHLLPETLFGPADLFGGQLRRVVEDIVERINGGERVVVVTTQAARIEELVNERVGGERVGGERVGGERSALSVSDADSEHSDGTRHNDQRSTLNAQHSTLNTQHSTLNAQRSTLVPVHGSLDEGFRSPDLGLTLYTDAEIFGWRNRRSMAERRRKRDRGAEERAAFLRGLKQGDHVVHIEHGIAVYEGLVRRSVGGIERDYLNLRYAEGDRLYVPVDQIDRVSRYIGAGEAAPQLTRLGTQDWERAKRKARQAVQDLADDLIQLYAQRQLAQGYAFNPDTEWQRELEASFPYTETPDQLKAIHDVKHDMESPHPMDRLVCGDVGFGKTEVALRAAFKAVQDGKQVAVLVPTTVLAQQHYETFTRRMAAFPVTIEMISRFRSAKEQAEIIRRLATGEVDIIVGTHRLLSQDIRLKDLGLLVVDEEQRFGVRHKERIKQLRANVDVLTLTATPIPRTLHMALAGIRDLSVIDTPPEDRLPIKTYVLPYEDNLVREAILRELERDGQVYFVHNRVHSIYYTADRVRQLVPEAEVGVGHGQLDEGQLEKVMLDFFAGKDDVLVCTTIIESGLDVANANTIIIDDATNYGLAQLYQLRGRVGRSTQRAYAYLFYRSERPQTPEAQERLQAIQEATELGAGFRIAMRDLEIRGAGNLLGAEQSGHIAAVGFDLYSRLLEQAVRTLKDQFVKANYITTKAEGRRPEEESTSVPRQPPTAAENRRAASNGGGHAPAQPPNGSASSDTGSGAISRAPRRQPQVKVDEKVLISPLVTLDLPIDACMPAEYVPDAQVRLAVYQRMAEAQTPRQVRELRQELRDRFGEPPEPAECLLTWLQIKALALQASVTSVVTSEEEFIVRLPEGSDADREKLRRRFGRNPAIRIGPQFVRLDRRTYNANGDDAWIAALTEVLETLAR